MKRHHSTIKPDPCSPRKRKSAIDTEDTEIDKENDVNITKKSSSNLDKRRKKTSSTNKNKTNK